MSLSGLVGCAAAALVTFAASAAGANAAYMWIDAPAADKDYYVAFRGRMRLDADTAVEVRLLGASWFEAWIDGEYVTQGPARFPVAHPQYESRTLRLAAGEHLLAVQVHHVGEETRMLPAMAAFLFCEARVDGQVVPMDWKAVRLGGYAPQVRRINPILGWIEWCDTRQVPAGWRNLAFDDSAWGKPLPARTTPVKLEPLSIGSVQQFTQTLRPSAQGPLANTYGYELDDIPARFFLRDQECTSVPSMGTWRRYDLGRVRLGRPSFTLDLLAGAIVEFAYAETLSHGRVAPYINLSTGPSCNLDHYVARGGVQTFCPLTPKAGRYLEIHVLAAPEQIRFVQETYLERCYHGPAQGSFTCSDGLLNRIWSTGVETYRACAEDALVDNPTRERGQWTGDVVSVGMDNASVAYADLRLLRRGLVHSAQCARADGLVAGLSPGTVTYLATYACQWTTAALHYYELTGDRALLEELFPAALKNFDAFAPSLKEHGLEDGLGWVFIDWGYVRNAGPADMAYNMHFLASVEAMTRWCRILGRDAEQARFEGMAQRLRACVQRWLDAELGKDGHGWQQVGYHRAVLALSLGLVGSKRERSCIEAIKRHMLDCFPNNRDAPRLADPGQANPRLITPYFAHYAFGPLIERGEMDFVLDQYRKCWGWMLEDDRTTWIEVFDPRWSHCHQWAGAPTWQLSRYALGLHHRFDLGRNHYQLKLYPGSLEQAQGALPLAGTDGPVGVAWKRSPAGVHYTVRCDQPIWLHLPDAPMDQPVEVVGSREWTFPVK